MTLIFSKTASRLITTEGGMYVGCSEYETSRSCHDMFEHSLLSRKHSKSSCHLRIILSLLPKVFLCRPPLQPTSCGMQVSTLGPTVERSPNPRTSHLGTLTQRSTIPSLYNLPRITEDVPAEKASSSHPVVRMDTCTHLENL